MHTPPSGEGVGGWGGGVGRFEAAPRAVAPASASGVRGALAYAARARAYGARSRSRLLRRSAHARGAREELTARRLHGVGEYRWATPRGWLRKSIIYMVKLVMYTYIYIYAYMCLYMLIYAYIC
jgi:hypothetical protein